MPRCLLSALVLVYACQLLSAVEPARRLTALFDQPLRDTAISRGPDQAWYLTGTRPSQSGDGSLDYANNDGIWAWRSHDLVTWESLGQIWSIARSPDKSFGSPSTWQGYWRGDGAGRRVRGMVSPELHFIMGHWYCTYSMNGFGIGLLKSTGTDAAGPYEDLGKIARSGRDGSLFADDDGSVYLVWDEGWIARLNDDLNALAEAPRLLPVSPEAEGGSWPLTIGSGGAFLFKAEAPGYPHGQYHLVGYDLIPRMGPTLCYDTFIASAEHIAGPYTRRDVLVPHGGHATIFPTDQGLAASFSGRDDWAAVVDRPAFVPLIDHATEWGADWWWCGAFTKAWQPVTEAGAWSEMEPFVEDRKLRDVSILPAPDGNYYLTCTDMELSRRDREQWGIEIWRSADMKQWESMGLVWHCDDSPGSRKMADQRWEINAGREKPFAAPFLYDIEMLYLHDNYYLVGSIQGGLKWFTENGMRVLILRSTSGTPEGPYEDVWQGPDTPDLWTPSLFEDDDGVVYIVGGGLGHNIGRLSEDCTTLVSELWQVAPIDGSKLGEGGHLLKIGRHYVHTTAVWHGADPYDKPMGRRGRLFSTYDLTYTTATDLHGPWSPTHCAAPKCGNARPFQAHDGTWYSPFFGNHFFGPWSAKPGAYPLQVRDEGNRLIIEAQR